MKVKWTLEEGKMTLTMTPESPSDRLVLEYCAEFQVSWAVQRDEWKDDIVSAKLYLAEKQKDDPRIERQGCGKPFSKATRLVNEDAMGKSSDSD